jgi:hypothetical protein
MFLLNINLLDIGLLPSRRSLNQHKPLCVRYSRDHLRTRITRSCRPCYSPVQKTPTLMMKKIPNILWNTSTMLHVASTSTHVLFKPCGVIPFFEQFAIIAFETRIFVLTIFPNNIALTMIRHIYDILINNMNKC